MKKIIPLILILFVLFLQFKAAAFLHLFPALPSVLAQDRPIDWRRSLEEALGMAAKEKKHIFLYFEKKNSPWCLKMQREILEDRGFMQEMQDLFVFVRLDAEKSENESSFFRVEKVPMVVLLDLQKEMISQISYLPFSGKKYASEMKKLLTQSADTGEAFKKRKKQNGDQLFSQNTRECALKKNWPLFYSGRFFSALLDHYALLLQQEERDLALVLEKRREIENLDPHNHLGLHLQLAFLDFYENSKKTGPETAIAPLVRYMDLFGKGEKQHLWLLQMTISQFLSQRGEEKMALFYARNAYRFAPSPIKKELAQTIRYLKEKSPNQEFSRK